MTWSIVSAYLRQLERERGAVIKDWGGRIPVALVFPQTYHAGMSNLGFQSMYALLNAWPDVVCERVFLPDPDLGAEYARTNTPLLSMETQRPVRDFEIVAFSVSYENDFPGVIKALNLARIPARSRNRGDSGPVVIAGGVSMRTNPEPLAEFLDLVLIGDGEVMIPPFLEAWREMRSLPLPKTNRIFQMACRMPGLYAPAWYEAALDRKGRLITPTPTQNGLPEKVSVVRAAEMPRPALTTKVLTPDTEFSDTKLVEIGRGCYHGCRFCLAGFVYRPPRSASLEAILDGLGEPETKGERVGLISPAVADHPQIETIIRTLTDQGREVTVASLRVESLTPGLTEALVKGKLKSAAVAPEAGTDRLRAAINKRLTEPEILGGVELLAQAGIRRLKLYFMLGLPTETDEDANGIADLTLRIKSVLLQSLSGRRLLPELTLTLSSFVPKPHTPFEHEPMADIGVLKDRARRIKSALRREKGVRVNFDSPKFAYFQTLLSRSDRRAGDIIEALAAPESSMAQVLKDAPFDPSVFVTRRLDPDADQPWSFIDHGFSDSYLQQEQSKALDGRLSPPCQPDVCRRCGVCPGNNSAGHPDSSDLAGGEAWR